MDVRALYPSLLASTSTKIITEVLTTTDIKIEGINWQEAGKYLAINLNAQEVNDLGLKDLVSTRIKKGGRNPGMTTAEVMGKLFREEGEETPSLFHPPQRSPTPAEKKIILAEVIRIATLAVRNNRTYQFNEETRLQAEESTIGLELAGALARVVMLWWDFLF